MLDDAPWLGRTVAVDGDKIETLTESNQCYTLREISCYTQNIQINKVIGENNFIEKLYFMGKYNCLATVGTSIVGMTQICSHPSLLSMYRTERMTFP